MRWLLPLLMYCSCTCAGTQTVVYPQPESASDPRAGYPIEVLKLALSKAGAAFVLQPTATPMQQGRALRQLAIGEGVSVVWSMTSIEREEQLRPIRIPLYKGLIGLRLLLIRAEDRTRVANLDEDQLRQLPAGQGHDWPDRAILAANGFKVVPSSTYEGLFLQLRQRRIDIFPRSITEIWDEAKARKAEQLLIDERFALYYPTAFYFFVNRDDERLATLLESGLEKSLTDGSFDALFTAYLGEAILASRLHQRHIIRLENPVLPAQTPLHRKELWYPVVADPVP